MESCISPNSIELILIITCHTSFPTIETLALLKNNIGLPNIYVWYIIAHTNGNDYIATWGTRPRASASR